MTPSHEVHETRVRPSVRFAEWLFGIAGGIALFLGLFIMFAGEHDEQPKEKGDASSDAEEPFGEPNARPHSGLVDLM